MSGDTDPEMLAKCFVESKESREADLSMQKIARELINQIGAIGPGDDAGELQDEIRAAVETTRKEFVLIVGNKGAGKSTFVDRFFKQVLERSLRDKCLLLNVDLRDSTGDKSQVVGWLTEKLVLAVEQGLFPNGVEFDGLQGVFHSLYQRWSKRGVSVPVREEQGRFQDQVRRGTKSTSEGRKTQLPPRLSSACRCRPATDALSNL